MRISTLILFLSALLFAGCGGESEAGSKPDVGAPDPGTAMAAQVHDVICGCAVDSIGHCGNYIVVDGKHLELTGDDLGLGPMEFCKKSGLKAEVVGKVEGDKFAATSFKYAQ